MVIILAQYLFIIIEVLKEAWQWHKKLKVGGDH
jgi:hypothetical protein